mgnify:FL=1
MTAEIPLSQGKTALIDDEEIPLVQRYRWCAVYAKHTKSYYAVSSMKSKTGDWRNMRMHRLIMNCPKDKQVDHINHDTLDNRKINLRIVNNAENNQNRRAQSGSKSEIRGVTWRADTQKWHVRVELNGKKHCFGQYLNLKDAEMAAKNARKLLMPFSQEAIKPDVK